jgi:hypothetical protein
MEAHPDFSISRSVYGAQFGQSTVHLGGGLKNWRPLRLEGARQGGDGTLIGGHIVFARNADIPDFSLVQYVGTEPNPDQDVRQARFFYDGIELGFYEYVRVSVSGGRMDYNPVYEVKATMRTLCNDLKDRAQYVNLAFSDGIAGKPHPSRLPANIYSSDSPEWESYATPARDARLRVAFAQFYSDLGGMIELWRQRDPRIAYDGTDLKADLEKAYAARAEACSIVYLNSDKQPVTLTFDDIVNRLFRLSFDPYQCIELRWGADGSERETCRDGRDSLRWYDEEQPLRNEMDRADGSPHSGSDATPPVDVKSLIDGIGARTPYTGMSAVGR